MSEMVQRVAMALADRKYAHAGGALADTMVVGKPNWIFCVNDARAAIAVMREPTEAMIASDQLPYSPGEMIGFWEIMIDAALSAAKGET